MAKLKSIKTLNADEIVYFCSQTALILDSGISLHDGMTILSEDAKESIAKELIESISKQLDDEKPFYIALEKTGVFSEYLINMVRIGELTGRLEEVLNGLTEYYERESELKKAVKSAVFQPLLLLAMMSVVIVVLVLKVLPIFKQVFSQFDSQMSETVSKTMSFATTAGFVALTIIDVVILAVVVLALISKSNTGKSLLIKLFSGFILTKKLFEKLAVSRFCNAMSLMINSGVDTTEALEITKELVDNTKVKNKINGCYEKVLGNEAFTDAIAASQLFPIIYTQSLRISYKSGAFDKAWRKISDSYNDEVNAAMQNKVTFIEPILVGILSIVIGTILVSVMLPLMGVMASLG